MPIATNPGWVDSCQTQILEIRRQLHDLSNVTTGLLITAGLLRHFVRLTGNGGRYASDIESSSERAAALVAEVRAGIHQLQAVVEAGADGAGADERTNVCDARPSLGQKSGED